MKERGIVFKAEEVRANLDGRKTQTRRIVKPQPVGVINEVAATDGTRWFDTEYWKRRSPSDRAHIGTIGFTCPCGVAGDRLWLREVWAHERQFDHLSPSAIPQSAHNASRIKYGSDIINNWHKRRSSIHMPRWASRITLEIVKVRVERVQQISEEDACAEGVLRTTDATTTQYAKSLGSHRDIFHDLWDSINGKGSWDANPWVWVIEFRTVNNQPE